MVRRTGRLPAIGASRGAYLFFGVVLLLSLGAAHARAASHIGRGDFDFFLDSAAFRDRDGKVLTEISLRIPSRGLEFDEQKGAWTSTVNLQMLITDDAGKEVLRKAEKVTFTEKNEQNEDNPVTFETVIKQLHLPPGGYWLSCRIEDLNAQKLSV